jgi:hypothetical protein
MSTNYYLRRLDAKDDTNDVHIGLSTADLFELEAHPRRGIVTIRDWRDRIEKEDVVVVDEYDNHIDKPTFLAVLADSRNQMAKAKSAIYLNCPQCPPANRPMKGQRYRDDEGYLFCNYVFS